MPAVNRLVSPARALAAVAAVSAAGLLPMVPRLVGDGPPAGTPTGPPAAPATALGQLPLRFEANHGQTDPSVQFLVRGTDFTAFLTGTGTVLARAGATPVRMQIMGSRPAPIVGQDRLPGVSNYLLGPDARNWLTGIPAFGAVRQPGVRPGVDMTWYDDGGRLKYDVVVAPGTDPAGVEVSFAGARALRVDGRGDLIVETDGDDLRQERPVVYQDVDGRRQPVSAAYDLRSTDRVGFELGPFDPNRPLVIDPPSPRR